MLTNDRTYLKGWYPGNGEVFILESLPRPMRQFLADAIEESPEFLEEYVLPTLNSPEPYDRILGDMAIAASALELEECGLGSYEENLGELGHLGKSLWKKIGKTLKKSLNPVKAIESTAKFVKREVKKEVKVTEKVFRKYGDIILSVAGSVLGPFTFGISTVAAALIVKGHQMYEAKKAAEKAKLQGNQQAAAMAADAAAQEAQVQQQVDAFYAQNQSWFVTNLGVTPDKWAQLTLQQKIDLINSGTTGQVPPNSTPISTPPSGVPDTPPPSQIQTTGPMPPSQPYQPQVTTPSIYGSGGPPPPGQDQSAMQQAYQQQTQQAQQMPGGAQGQDWSQYIQAATPGGFSPQQQAPTPVAQSSMFGDMSGMMLPAALIAAAVIFTQGGSKGGSGRRTRRNPRRRRRW
jgi:hypothetical protein